MQHVEAIKRQEAYERMWEINVASFPHMDRQDRKHVRTLLRQLSEFSLKPRQSPYDLAPPQDRIRMIGSAITAGRQHDYDWLTHHPRQADWLESQGVSVEECVSQYREWFEAEMARTQWSDRGKDQDG